MVDQKLKNVSDSIKIGFVKQAQAVGVDTETLAELIKRADNGLLQGLASTLQGAKDFVGNTDFSNPTHDWRSGLLGAGLGAGLGGLYNAFGNIGKKDEEKDSILGGALRGGLLGGAGGFATPHLKSMFAQPPQVAQQPLPQAPPNVSVAAPEVTVNTGPEPELRPELAALKQQGLAPYKTRGNLTTGLTSLLPFGSAAANLSVDPDARNFDNTFSQFNNLVTLPAAGLGAGAVAASHLKGGPSKAVALGAGNWLGNMLGSMRYRNDQANAMSNMAATFTPEALLENKNISTALRGQLAQALQSGDPSVIRDAVGSLSALTPEQQIPTQFKMVQDAVADQAMPGWYEDPSILGKLRNIFTKQ